MGREKERQNIHVPTGTLILISVLTNFLPLASILHSSAEYKSCPAANALPFVGAFACSLSNCTCSCCSAAAPAAIEGAMGAGGCRADMLVGVCVLARGVCVLARGVCVLARGVGVAAPESE
jgi:hypothetical protein